MFDICMRRSTNASKQRRTNTRYSFRGAAEWVSGVEIENPSAAPLVSPYKEMDALLSMCVCVCVWSGGCVSVGGLWTGG